MTTNLTKLERQIHAFEGTYLEDTHQYGNISNGYEEYRGLSSEDNVEQTRRKRKFKENDRIFSKSSLTSREAVEQGGQEVRGAGSVSEVKEESEIKVEIKERKKIKPKA